MAPVGLQARRLFHHVGVFRWYSPQGNTNGVTERCIIPAQPIVGMLSGGKTSASEKLDSFSDDLVVKRNVGDAPLPGGDVNSHTACVTSMGAAEKNRQEGYRNSVPPRDVTGEAFGLNDAAVLTPAVAGAASLAVFAGAAAPADPAGMMFPAIAGMELPAVAEDLSLADDVGGLPSAVCVSEPLWAAAEADPLIDVEATPFVDLRGPAGPSAFHASRGSDEDGSPFDIVIEPEPIVCPGVGGNTDPPPAGRPACFC